MDLQSGFDTPTASSYIAFQLMINSSVASSKMFILLIMTTKHAHTSPELHRTIAAKLYIIYIHANSYKIK